MVFKGANTTVDGAATRGGMRELTGRLAIALLAALALFAFQLVRAQTSSAATGVACPQTGNELVSTDRAAYAPGSLVHVSGMGYFPGCDVVVKVTRPDGSVVSGDGSFAPGSDTVTTDPLGNFTYDYLLPSNPAIEGTYSIDVLGLADTALAHTTFEDAPTLQLYLDAAHTPSNEDYIYAAGATVFAHATQLQTTDSYKLEVKDQTGASRSLSSCISGVTSTDSSFTTLATDLSNANDFQYVLHSWNNSTNCTGTLKDFPEPFNVAKATVYSNPALTIQQSSFGSGTALAGTVAKTSGGTTLTGTGTSFTTQIAVGDVISVPHPGGTDVRRVATITNNTSLTVNLAWSATASGQTATKLAQAYVSVAGYPQGTNQNSVTWNLPGGGVACKNTAGGNSDRPDSGASGGMPSSVPQYLEYVPSGNAANNDKWNALSNYDAPNVCPLFSSSNDGQWTLTLFQDSTHFVTLNVFSVDATAPAQPILTSTTPASPANNNNPSIKGTAEAGSAVKLYTNSTCTSAVAGTGTATAGNFSIAVSVADNTATTYWATATDAVGNTSACSSSNITYVEDSTNPTVNNVSATNANGTYATGDTIHVTIQFSESVTVTGTPRLQLETGTTDEFANYVSGSGTNTLTFDYAVVSGDASNDLDYTSTGALTLNGGTIKDAAGNNATLTLPAPGAAGSLGANKNIVIDTTADLSVTKTDGVTSVTAGAATTHTYTITVSNAGPAPATSVSLSDTFPGGFTRGAVTPSQGSCTGSPSFSCALGTIAKNGTATVTVDYTVPSSTTADQTNTATVSSVVSDPNGANNSASDTDTFNTLADLSVSKSGPATAVAGDPAGFNYTLTVHNGGPSDNVGGFHVTDTLNSNLTFQSTGSSSGCTASGQTVTCSTASGLASGAPDKVFTVHVTLASTTGSGVVISNTGTVTSDGTSDPNGANNTSAAVTTTVQENVVLSVSKNFNSATVTAGGASKTFTVSVTNSGFSDADNLSLTDTVDSRLIVDSVNAGSYSCPDGDLPRRHDNGQRGGGQQQCPRCL